MSTIMMNLNKPVPKDVEVVKTEIAQSPFFAVTKFTWDNFRFTIEHHRISEWTIAIENIEKEELVEYEEYISTFILAEMLNKYLV